MKNLPNHTPKFSPLNKVALKKLKQMGLEIDNDQEALEYINAYKFKTIAYDFGNYFKLTKKDRFGKKINLKHIIRVIHIDVELRVTLISMLAIFEDWLGFSIINFLDHKYGSEAFNCKDNFANHSNLKRILRYIAIERTDEELTTTLYPLDRIRFLSFGSKILLLSCIKPHVRRKFISNLDLDININHFELFYIYNSLRNHCCHLKYLFNDCECTNYTKPTNIRYFDPEYSLLFNIIVSLMKFIPSVEMNKFINKLSSLFLYEEDQLLSCFGFPPNWEDILRKKLTN